MSTGGYAIVGQAVLECMREQAEQARKQLSSMASAQFWLHVPAWSSCPDLPHWQSVT